MINMKVVLGLFFCGVLALILAIINQVVVPNIIDHEIKKNLVLTDDQSTTRYQQWKRTTIPVYLKYYVFDIINKDEIRQGKRPVVEQRGPYTYREYMDKMDIEFNNSLPLVAYNQKKWYVYEQGKSCETCNPYSDNVTTINTPYAIMAEVASTYNGLAKFVINLMLAQKNEDLIMTKSVHELIWGYNDSLFEEFATLRKKYHLFFIPEISPLMRFQPNNSFDGEVEINTGRKDIDRVGVWETWKGQNSLALWKTIYANMLNGSDGTQFHPGVETDDDLYFFSPNLCRSVLMKHDSDEVIKGVNVLRFTVPSEVFQNGSQNPDNEAFCPHRCYPDGILAGSQDCKPSTSDSPIVVSTPHFLIGDPSLRDNITGLQPDKEKHGLFISIEPLTGIPLQALIRLQLNLHIRPVQGISGTNGIRESYVPVVYFSNEVTVDDSTASMMRNKIFLPLNICYYSKIILFALGGLLILLAIGLFVYRNKKSFGSHRLQRVESILGSKSDKTVQSSATEKTPLTSDVEYQAISDTDNVTVHS